MGAWSRAQWMTLLVVGGAGIYFGTMYVLGMRVHELRVRPAGPQRAVEASRTPPAPPSGPGPG